MAIPQYYTGRYFAAFLGASLLVVAVLFAGLYGVHGGLPSASIAIDTTVAASAAPMAAIGFALGVFGGGTVLMLTGWYLVRK